MIFFNGKNQENAIADTIWGFRGVPRCEMRLMTGFFIVNVSPDKVPDPGTVSD